MAEAAAPAAAPPQQTYEERDAESDEITRVIDVDKDDAPFILGRGGATKRKVARVSCTEIELDEHTLTITIVGKRDDCDRAQDYLVRRRPRRQRGFGLRRRRGRLGFVAVVVAALLGLGLALVAVPRAGAADGRGPARVDALELLDHAPPIVALGRALHGLRDAELRDVELLVLGVLDDAGVLLVLGAVAGEGRDGRVDLVVDAALLQGRLEVRLARVDEVFDLLREVLLLVVVERVVGRDELQEVLLHVLALPLVEVRRLLQVLRHGPVPHGQGPLVAPVDALDEVRLLLLRLAHAEERLRRPDELPLVHRAHPRALPTPPVVPHPEAARWLDS